MQTLMRIPKAPGQPEMCSINEFMLFLKINDRRNISYLILNLNMNLFQAIIHFLSNSLKHLNINQLFFCQNLKPTYMASSMVNKFYSVFPKRGVDVAHY